MLIVSELASNAVMCSTSCDEFFFVRVELNSDYVLAEVEDLGPLCHCEQSDGSPRSLDLVGALVGPDDWGVQSTSDGRRIVWARLYLAAASKGNVSLPSSIALYDKEHPDDHVYPG